MARLQAQAETGAEQGEVLVLLGQWIVQSQVGSVDEGVHLQATQPAEAFRREVGGAQFDRRTQCLVAHGGGVEVAAHAVDTAGYELLVADQCLVAELAFERTEQGEPVWEVLRAGDIQFQDREATKFFRPADREEEAGGLHYKPRGCAWGRRT